MCFEKPFGFWNMLCITSKSESLNLCCSRVSSVSFFFWLTPREKGLQTRSANTATTTCALYSRVALHVHAGIWFKQRMDMRKRATNHCHVASSTSGKVEETHTTYDEKLHILYMYVCVYLSANIYIYIYIYTHIDTDTLNTSRPHKTGTGPLCEAHSSEQQGQGWTKRQD
jgi:hypothetical protein